MKTYEHCLPLGLLLSLIGLLTAALSPAASLSLVITPSHPTVADPAYPGTGSTVTTATDSGTGLTVSMSGKNYGPGPGQISMGIRNGSIPGKPAPVFIVTSGLAPAAAGSKTTADGKSAAYISFVIGNVLPNTLFQDLSINFNGLTFTRATNPWAAASVGGFNNWVAANTSGTIYGRTLSVTLPSFTWTGEGDSLEIRLYGVTGSEQGTFNSVAITGLVIPAPLIPEPTPFVFALVASAWFFRRRRFQSVVIRAV